MNGKGSGRRKEATPGAYAAGYDRIWSDPRARTLSFVGAILKVWGEVVLGADNEIYILNSYVGDPDREHFCTR